MYLKEKLQTLKMRKYENVTKHIHLFQAFFEQLVTIGALILGDEMIPSKMKTMSPSYKKFRFVKETTKFDYVIQKG
jgi:hypothetical protein